MVGSVKKPVQRRHLKCINLVGPKGDISKKDLKVVKQRFLNLHKLKMQRAIDAVTPRQKIFLELLPLLFHVNHPVLPGYVSSETPAGIADYAPDKISIDKAKKLGKGFVYSKRAKRAFGIESIFLMGSVGSIAYVKDSDMDLWLCYAPNLSTNALALLQEKASSIEKWAATLGLEVHFFLMNAEKFKQGEATPLSSESSGSTQHHLLLEEFYRTALYVAGRYPVWWLVPPTEENNYQVFVDNLLKQRFIEQHDVIDFGGLEKVPAEEFLGASFWHLYKAIDSPYKSLLKLMLMESYVDQYPRSPWAALLMKKRVYAGESNANKLDAYLILYDVLEAYFIGRDEPERLNLMRYCFFSKLNEHARIAATPDWRQRVFSEMLAKCQPLPDYIKHSLDNKGWNISQAQQEKQRLTHELTYSYRLLVKFSKQRVEKSRRDNEEFLLLGRKLNATFEKRPSKLERSTIKHTLLRPETKVVLTQVVKNTQTSWLLDRLSEGHNEQFIRQAPSLIGLLAWSVDNGVIGSRTKVALNPGVSQMNSREVAQTLHSTQSFFDALPKKAVHLKAYCHESVVTDVLLVINSGLDSMSSFTEKGVNLTSERSDALSFGSQRRNLVYTVDMLLRNSWNEVIIGKYESATGLMKCFCDIFDQKTLGSAQVLPRLVSASYNSPRAMSVAKRIQELFKEVAIVFRQYADGGSPRFVIQLARSFYIMQVNDGKMTATGVAENHLLEKLAWPQPVFSPVYFDNKIDPKGLLPVIYRHHKAGHTNLYYNQLGDNKAQVYILDGNGSMFYDEQTFVYETSLLQSYRVLIDSVFHRRVLDAERLCSTAFDAEIMCYKLEKIGQHWEHKQVFVSDKIEPDMMNVRVVYDEQTKGTYIYCNDQVFSSLEEGDQLYSSVSRFIVKARKSAEKYPIYITDIDVPYYELGASSDEALQMVHYLNYKQRIEQKLNV